MLNLFPPSNSTAPSILDRVKQFLPQIQQANDKLTQLSAEELNIEVTDGDYYVEMDLALGVLEKRPAQEIAFKQPEILDTADAVVDFLESCIGKDEMTKVLIEEMDGVKKTKRSKKPRTEAAVLKRKAKKLAGKKKLSTACGNTTLQTY